MSFSRKPKTIDPNEVDPSVYYYDEVYDDMKEKETSHGKEQNEVRKTKQGSKYIQGIAETADRRKSEKEIRKFKRYARDREEAEANGELDNTDVYVSRSYKKKLEEVQNALKKGSKTDRDRELNVFKKHKTNDDQETSRVKPRQTSSAGQIEHDRANDDTHAGSTSQEQQTNTTKLRPKTIEERREYLRNVLKKQTVGDAFDAAVERYKQRKAPGSS